MMEKMTLQQVQRCAFSVLQAVRDVCRRHGLNYSLTGGTLLGAVRHGGFIPWDDDIDIMMPRPDYEKLLHLAREEDLGFDLRCAELNGQGYPYLYAKACCRGTLVQEKGVRACRPDLGVFVDIFPVDGIGNWMAAAKLRAMYFTFLQGMKLSLNWEKYLPSKRRKWCYEPLRYLCFLVGRMLGRKRVDRMTRRFLRRRSFDTCAYAGRLTGDFGSREVMPRRMFEEKCTVMFEGEAFDALADCDGFLSALYGDYMCLPPQEQRVSHHDFESFWVKNEGIIDQPSACGDSE